MALPSPPAAGQGVTISGPLRTANRTPAARQHLPLKFEVCRGGGNPAFLQVHEPRFNRVEKTQN